MGEFEHKNIFAGDYVAVFAGKVKAKLGFLRLVDMLAVFVGASPGEDRNLRQCGADNVQKARTDATRR